MAFIGKQPPKAAITSSDITDGVVTADKLASDSVTTAKIADNGVTTAKINADAVTDAKIADDVVGAEHLTAGEVDTTALGADAVTAAKIADDAINSEHYTDGSIDTAHIADSNVTQAKIADQAINEAKLQISNSPTNGYFLSAQSGNTGGLTWAEAGGGGKINQVVTNYDTTERRTNSTSFQAATGIDLNITPSATNSKVLITFGLTLRSSSSNSIYSIRRTISGTTAALTTEGDYQGYSRLEDSDKSYPCFLEYLDSPNTTSQVTYQIYFKNNSGGYAYINEHGSSYSHIRAMEVLA
tara:strand:- start:2384 stop:3277 length:894 start_codon:yes stop_codon:yes gene_type:complete